MTPSVQRILALNTFARDSSHLHESWASIPFKRTYEAALCECKDLMDHSFGMQVAWYPDTPDHVTVYRTNLATERTQVLRQLPLEGEVARALFEDLQALAILRAEEVIRQEREDALHRAAVSRVNELLQQADQPAHTV